MKSYAWLYNAGTSNFFRYGEKDNGRKDNEEKGITEKM